MVAANGVTDYIEGLRSTSATDLPENLACCFADLVDGVKVTERENEACVIRRDRGDVVEVKGWVSVDESFAKVHLNELLYPRDQLTSRNPIIGMP
jgi:hypothetical protein